MKKFLLASALIILLTPSVYAQKDDIPEVKFQRIVLTDTSEAEDYIEPENITLKGYAQYIEDSQAIHLLDNKKSVINLKVPQRIAATSLTKGNIFVQRPKLYSKYESEEYQISPKDLSSFERQGGFSYGTNMEQAVDWGELKHTATFFTRYDKGRFSFNTAYKRTIGSTYNNYFDNFYIAPELRLNKFMSIKNTVTADITNDRKKNEIVLSVKPLANTREDRLNLEFGASQTYDSTNSLIRKQIKVNTRLEL